MNKPNATIPEFQNLVESLKDYNYLI